MRIGTLGVVAGESGIARQGGPGNDGERRQLPGVQGL